MANNYPNKSLLGQLKSDMFVHNETDFDLSLQKHLPFGILTSGAENSENFYEDFEENKNEDEIKDTDNSFEKKEPKIIKKRLNDLDFNMFQEGNYLNIDDNELTDNEKAIKIKQLIKKIDEKLYMLEDSDDELLKDGLKNEKEALLCTLGAISDENSFKNIALQEISSKIKGFEKFIFKLFPPLRRNYLVRRALRKLVMLNENAKEAVLTKIPYGESEGRYNDLTAYLSCANVIHAKLAKKMN